LAAPCKDRAKKHSWLWYLGDFFQEGFEWH
jgi:hypothetical protein